MWPKYSRRFYVLPFPQNYRRVMRMKNLMGHIDVTVTATAYHLSAGV